MKILVQTDLDALAAEANGCLSGDCVAHDKHRIVLESPCCLSRMLMPSYTCGTNVLFLSCSVCGQPAFQIRVSPLGKCVHCVFCGYNYGPDDGSTPYSLTSVLISHVASCPSHPMKTFVELAQRSHEEFFKQCEGLKQSEHPHSDLLLNLRDDLHVALEALKHVQQDATIETTAAAARIATN
jgi:hypothetical protein